MKIQKGQVQYKDRNDYYVTYGETEDGKQYYFIDKDIDQFSNGNRVASTALVEAIDEMVKANNVGMINENGDVVIPFTHRRIKPINETTVLAELANPTSQSVIDANTARSDATAATGLVSTANTIKDKINAKMGSEGRFVFNDLFSEADVYDINGNKLIDGEFSFIGIANDKLYCCKNTADSEIVEYALFPPQVQENVANDQNEINVGDVEVSPAVVDEAMNNEGVVAPTATDQVEVAALGTEVEEDAPQVEEAPVEAVAPVAEEATSAVEEEIPQVEEAPVEAVAPVAEETTSAVEEEIPQVEEAPVEAVAPVAEETTPAVEEEIPQVEEAPVEAVAPVAEETTPAVEEEIPQVEEAPVEAVVPVTEETTPAVEEEIEDDIEDDIEEEPAVENTPEEISEDNSVDLEDEIPTDADDVELNFDVDEATDESEDDYKLEDSQVQVDSITKEDEEYNNLVEESNTDPDIVQGAEIVGKLIQKVEYQKGVIADLNNRVAEQDEIIDKKDNTIRNIAAKATRYEEKNEILLRGRKEDRKVNVRLANTNAELTDKIHNQERIIDAQAAELESLREQLRGKKALVGMYGKALKALGELDATDEFDTTYEEEGSYRRAA